VIPVQVHTLGDGDPDVAVVGSIHGDERCGKKAIERFLDSDLDIQKPVKLIVANEKALAANTRYLDTDLNRVFPGDPDSSSHEKQLAAALIDEVQGCTVLDLHSTKSYDRPFAIVSGVTATTTELIQATGVDQAVDMAAFSEGDLITHCDGVLVECGPLGSQDAVDQAYEVLRNFLAAYGVIEDTHQYTNPDLFRGTAKIPKPEPYHLQVENFEQVETGQVYAENDSDTLTADEAFYPVLMSETGYADILGFHAEKLGTLSAVKAEHVAQTPDNS
jgi:predicted deacylase